MAVSQEVLMLEVDETQVRPRQLPQYVANLSVGLGAISVGLVLGWTSPAGEDGANLQYSFEMDSEVFSWVSSIMFIGASVTTIPVGKLNDFIGRKWTMLFLTVPFTIGWACVIWANSVLTLIIGRLTLGSAACALFVTGTVYTAEISDNEARGRLNSYLGLFYYTGVLGCYALGLLKSMFLLSLISAAVPFVFSVVFFFMPETPTYYLMKGNVEAARKTLIWLRGTKYDVEFELEEKRAGVAAAGCRKGAFFIAIRSRAGLKGLLIAYGLMVFQIFSGVDVIIFYVSDIFIDATGRDGILSGVGVGAIQVVAVFLQCFVIDKWGRRLLLLISGSGMCLSFLVLGIYFYFHGKNTSINYFEWVPLVSISCFVTFYSFGYAVIPWLMVGELFSPQIKTVAASSASITCWIVTFIVVKFYNAGKAQIGSQGMFWTFSTINAAGVVFVYFIVPETKNKSLEQIQIELCGKVGTGQSSESTDL